MDSTTDGSAAVRVVVTVMMRKRARKAVSSCISSQNDDVLDFVRSSMNKLKGLAWWKENGRLSDIF